MRKLALLFGVLALAGGAAALLLDRDPVGPFPSASDLRMRGFAAWPVDTVEEAEEECAGAEAWRLDARETAVRFASDVLRYPKPHAGDAYDEDDHHVRLLIGSDDEPGVFLGSALDLDRYGRCWYVTQGIPREDELGASLGFVYRDGRPYLLLGNPNGVPTGVVGFGDWETEIDPGLRQTVMWMPELDPDATGHVIHVAPDERGVSEIVGARSLGVVPPPPSGPPLERAAIADVVDDPALCRIEAARYKTPEQVIRNLYRWTFDDLLRQVNGYARFERKAFRHLGGDRWRLVVDDAVLIARIPEIAGRCYQLVSMKPVKGDAPLRRLWVDDLGVTFGLDWGGGDEASLAFGSASGGAGATLKQIREPVTFPLGERHDGGPGFARVVLYEDGHVVSAFQGFFAL